MLRLLVNYLEEAVVPCMWRDKKRGAGHIFLQNKATKLLKTQSVVP